MCRWRTSCLAPYPIPVSIRSTTLAHLCPCCSAAGAAGFTPEVVAEYEKRQAAETAAARSAVHGAD